MIVFKVSEEARTMSAYAMFQIRITDAETYKQYVAQVAPTIAQYGGRFLVRGGAYETLEGEWPEWRHVVLEFPSKEQARAWYDSPEYTPLKRLRQSASEGRGIIIEGAGS
jgi:uncharacterized protein (DUF1330 family)